MRLLFDENLSTALPRALADTYSDSAHVLDLGLGRATDDAVWKLAAAEERILVTKDEDFERLSVLRGAPPKVIWIRLGNCTTEDVVRLLRLRREQIQRFAADPDADFLALG